jgi:hypothetical protein
VDLRRFRESLARYGGRVDDRLAGAARKIMLRVERAAKLRAPVDTGQMRASIAWHVSTRAGRIVGRIGSAVAHAKYTEFPNRSLRRGKKKSRTGAGTVRSPYTSWPALKARGGHGQTMPWLRPAVVDVVSVWARDLARRAALGSGRGR